MTTNRSQALKPGVVVGIVVVIVLAMSALAAVANAVSDPPESTRRPTFGGAPTTQADKGAAHVSIGSSANGGVHLTIGSSAKGGDTTTVDFGNGLTARTPKGWNHTFDEDSGLDVFTDGASDAEVNVTFYTVDSGRITSDDVIDAYLADFVEADFTDVVLQGEGPNGDSPFDVDESANPLLGQPRAIVYDAFVTTQSQGNIPISGIVIGAVIDDDLGIAIEALDSRPGFNSSDFSDQDALVASIARG